MAVANRSWAWARASSHFFVSFAESQNGSGLQNRVGTGGDGLPSGSFAVSSATKAKGMPIRTVSFESWLRRQATVLEPACRTR